MVIKAFLFLNTWFVSSEETRRNTLENVRGNVSIVVDKDIRVSVQGVIGRCDSMSKQPKQASVKPLNVLEELQLAAPPPPPPLQVHDIPLPPLPRVPLGSLLPLPPPLPNGPPPERPPLPDGSPPELPPVSPLMNELLSQDQLAAVLNRPLPGELKTVMIDRYPFLLSPNNTPTIFIFS